MGAESLQVRPSQPQDPLMPGLARGNFPKMQLACSCSVSDIPRREGPSVSRSVSVVVPPMLRKAGPLPEGFSALTALIGLFFIVDPHVLSKVGVQSEGFLAYVARERFFSSVNPVMSNKV